MTPKVVLVTGVSRFLGAQIAARLAADEGVERVLGVDATPPRGDLATVLDGVEVIRVDAENTTLPKIIEGESVDTVIHMAVVSSPARLGGRAAMKELNVIGTMRLLAACQQAPTLRKLVVRSSTAAYGLSPWDPAVFTEDTEPRELPRGGFARDIADIEGYVRGFRRRRPEAVVTTLRFAPFVGPRVDTAMTKYFSLPTVPTVLGYDPRIQFVHVDDALEVIHRSTVDDHHGVFNVAGPGVLTLSQAVRRAGRVPVRVPEPGLGAFAEAAKRFGFADFSLDQLEFLVYGRVVDVSRLAGEYGFVPRPTVEAFDDFVRGQDLSSVLSPDNIATAERIILDRARQVREKTADADARTPEKAGWERALESGAAFLRRRMTGEYDIDDFGADADLTENVLLPLLRPLYKKWFRVEVKGAENLPSDGAALLVSNHSGTIPVDGLMLQLAVHDEHPEHRHLRLLAADLALQMPVVSEYARKMGHTLACHPDAERLLRAGELVGVFPEGFKGVGKPFAERYKLRRFGRGGFVSAALRTGAPIIPISIVGAEEIYPMISDLKPLARLLGFPYFPVTPTFPWLGPLGLVPLPSKWLIEIGEPIATEGDVERADDPMAVFNLSDQVRETIQQTLYKLLRSRNGVFAP